MYKLLRWIATSATLCLLAAGCSHQRTFFRRKLYFTERQPVCPQQTKQIDPTITIWIHGARPFGANKYNLGLKSPTLFDPANHSALSAYTLIKSDPIKFPLDHFYIYSWSGILDFSERQRAANILHAEIVQLIETYKKLHGIVPRIRILAHSHGGNVALNLAAVANNNLIIDELILLAVPVQARNKKLANSPLFKRIFSLYSTIDYAQIIDPQGIYHDSGTYALFSGQRFEPSPNLMQVKTKINGAACQHLQFNDLPTLKILSPIIDQLNQWMDELPEDVLLCGATRFMLSVYTNGRRPPRAKCYRTGGAHEHVELSIPSA